MIVWVWVMTLSVGRVVHLLVSYLVCAVPSRIRADECGVSKLIIRYTCRCGWGLGSQSGVVYIDTTLVSVGFGTLT